jgi:hypothetical protein
MAKSMNLHHFIHKERIMNETLIELGMIVKETKADSAVAPFLDGGPSPLSRTFTAP